MCVRESLQTRISSLRIWLIVISETRKVLKHMNVEPRPYIHKDLKDIAIILRSIDIEL